jgi:predicted transcriptional regulator
MSAVVFPIAPHCTFRLVAQDGTFDKITPPAPRREPYLYISGPNCTVTLDFTTQEQVDGLLEAAQRIAEHFGDWKAHLEYQEFLAAQAAGAEGDAA